MELWFPEINFAGAWTPLGDGYTSYFEARDALLDWQNRMKFYRDECFRFRRHVVATPPPELVEDCPF